ncbi:MAG: hypothetical protein A2X32_09365 [Elusimicrobia bacterium GWC2_64_44]|nr:MAG: hypothetical protein A2X32_09365 [Elusimicrobia bacterium GWC2_64_44]
MKNTKAIFFIILGAFIMATGFAFAKDQPAYDSLRNGPFGASSAVELTPVSLPAGDLNKALPMTEVKKPEQKAVPEVAPAAKVEEPKPTFTEKVGEFFGKYRRDIFRTGIGAFIGFALIGTIAGALTGGLLCFAFFYMAGMSNVGKK